MTKMPKAKPAKKPTKKQLEQDAREKIEQRIREQDEQIRLEREKKNKSLMQVISSNRFLIGLSLKGLAETITDDIAYCDLIVYNAAQAERYLHQFLSSVDRDSTPQLTEEEANISATFHTFLRKCCVSPASSILYNMIEEDRGISVWYAFIKGLGTSLNYENAMNEVRRVQSNGISDLMNMKSCLQMIRDDVFDFRSSGWLEDEKPSS